jgi:hypothetical protein
VSFTVTANTGSAARKGTLLITEVSYSGQFVITQNGVNSGLTFVPVTSCRVVDTRNAAGAFGGPELAAMSTRSFVLPANSSCNLPQNAAAYALNITVVPDAQLGYLSIWPEGQPQPTVSTLNSDGRIKASAAITPAGTSGAVSVFVTNSTQLIMDVTGYFVAAGAIPQLEFYPLPPCRVADTRKANGALGGPYLSGGTVRSFPVLLSVCGIPSSAQVYSLNFTAIPHGSLGYLTVWPEGQPQPLVSTLNAPTGTITANAAIVASGSGGGISTYGSNDTDLVIDVDGYFAPAGSGGLSLYTLTPCRVLDTRNSSGAFSGTLLVSVQGARAAYRRARKRTF